MFNGYEIWKPDAERCTHYRLTNAKGSACGRCMKTCPLNKVVTADGPLLERVASWCGINARWLKPLLVPIAVRLDDFLGKGKRNPVKKWWFDLEVVDDVCVEPLKGVSHRDLNLSHKIDPYKQNMAYYLANMMPVPNNLNSQPVDRKAAVAMGQVLESPITAAIRANRGEPAPKFNTPTPAASWARMSSRRYTGIPRPRKLMLSVDGRTQPWPGLSSFSWALQPGGVAPRRDSGYESGSPTVA